MAIVFPPSPSLNQTYTAGGNTYTWDGVSWRSERPVLTASGGLFDVNTPPASPHVMDDEFDSTIDSVKWRNHQGGNPSAALITRESCLTTSTLNANGGIILQTMTDSSWKIRMAVCLPQWFSGANQVVSFNMYRTANQRSSDYGHWSDGSNNRRPVGNYFSGNYTAWNGLAYSGTYGNDGGILGYKMNYWEFESNGTAVTWRWSNTGYENAWRTMHTQNFSGWLGAPPDKVGIWLASVPVALIDWFRRIS